MDLRKSSIFAPRKRLEIKYCFRKNMLEAKMSSTLAKHQRESIELMNNMLYTLDDAKVPRL